MVKISRPNNKKHYKRKEYGSKRYNNDFPVKANPQIAPHEDKHLTDIAVTSKDTPK
jgi:hypothetical protein